MGCKSKARKITASRHQKQIDILEADTEGQHEVGTVPFAESHIMLEKGINSAVNYNDGEQQGIS